jgi:hypothetical protein
MEFKINQSHDKNWHFKAIENTYELKVDIVSILVSNSSMYNGSIGGIPRLGQPTAKLSR